MSGFRGNSRMHSYFEGWYLKHQYEGGMIAFIPAFHADAAGKWTASVQVITDEGSWYFPIPVRQCTAERQQLSVRMGENRFSQEGISVNLEQEGLSVTGRLKYGSFHKITGDIMGPFRWVPLMQCRHTVISMYHKVTGQLCINGKEINLSGIGYIEGDRGNSFPEHYLWTQCLFDVGKNDSIMFSAADIPMWGFQFRGCICAVCYRGHEYRFATYRGCRIETYQYDKAVIRQGRYQLKIIKLTDSGKKLRAPVRGEMARMIKESPSCAVRYQLWKGQHKIFDITSSRASFEYV